MNLRSLATFLFLASIFAAAQSSTTPAKPLDAKSMQQRYEALTRSWAEQAVFTPAEERAMEEGRKREDVMTNSLQDVLGQEVLSKGEPSYAALASMYPGKILDRTLLGSYSDPSLPASGSNEEFVIWWNGAISANLLYDESGKNRRVMAENTNILFRVGDAAEMFGQNSGQYTHLRYEDADLPIVQASYTADGLRYAETAFADRLSGEDQDTAYIRFDITNPSAQPREGVLTEEFTLTDGASVDLAGDEVLDATGKVLLGFAGGTATFDAKQQRLTHRVQLQPHATAAIILQVPYSPLARDRFRQVTAADFPAAHSKVHDLWAHLLEQATQITVPEQRVNDMWRSLLLQNFVIADGPRFTYGSGLEYNNSFFPFEDGFAAISMARYGYAKGAEGWLNYLIPASVDPKRAGHRYQNRRAMPLYLLYEEYRLTGRADYFEQNKEELYRVADEIIRDRHSTMTATNGPKPWHWGLLPPAQPAVDTIAAASSDYVPAHDITNCMGLQNFGEFLVETGIDVARGKRYLAEASDFRKAILRALNESVIRAAGKPPFVPLESLYFRKSPFGPEPYDNLSLGRPEGSYYHYWVDMELHYNFFNPDDELAHWMVNYVDERGGLVLGCTRARTHPGSPYGWINDNYNAGYYAYALRRGDVERFLLGFYSRLAFDSSRNTYVNSEAEPFIGYNTRDGGFVGAEYTFPNSAANAETLDLLRFMLVLEEKKDNVDTGILDLARGTPRAWLEDGKKIEVERALTDFGTLSFTIDSHLQKGSIAADIQAPQRVKFQAIRLYLRAPESHHLKRVRVNGKPYHDFNAANGYITLPAGPAEFRVEAEYR